MADSVEVCEFLWQYEQRKKWITYSSEEMEILNNAVKDKKKDVLLPSKNSRKQLVFDFEKMVQKNTKSLYEQKGRCVVSNEGFFAWQWEDENNDWHSYKPLFAFYLEVAYSKKDKKIDFFDNNDYEVDFDSWTQFNKETKCTTSIRRVDVILQDTAELKNVRTQIATSFKRLCSNDIPSAKKMKTDSRICLASNSVNSLPDSLSNYQQETSSSTSEPASIDLECLERENFHIYVEGNTSFSATLNQTNLQNNNNKFYLIQLLEHNQKKLYSVWRRWGRVGLKGQTDHTKYGSSLCEAKSSFEDKFYAKTRNRWDEKNNFSHVKGKYDLLQMDLGVKKVETKKFMGSSKLDLKIQSLLDLICDQKRMEEMMKEMSYDSNKTPLGKLTLKQVRDGYVALNKVAAALKAGGAGSALINACNDFYTKIPHSFGMKTPPIIRTQADIDEKIRMLEALSNITVAMNVLNAEATNTSEHPLDKYYRSLDCSLEAIERNTDEYNELEKCLKGTHGLTHTTYEMEIIEVYKCNKSQEQMAFKNHENKLLLWHGSRISNWLGILKEGLRIAPPEAPSTGYMFGKGIYFADVSSKSANYCFATKRKNEGLLLLSEVSVGSQFTLTEADESMPVNLPSEFNSVLGKGRVSPSAFESRALSSDAKAPYGPLIENSDHVGTLQYNEYIVYDVNQVKMKYLLRIKFNFK